MPHGVEAITFITDSILRFITDDLFSINIPVSDSPSNTDHCRSMLRAIVFPLLVAAACFNLLFKGRMPYTDNYCSMITGNTVTTKVAVSFAGNSSAGSFKISIFFE